MQVVVTLWQQCEGTHTMQAVVTSWQQCKGTYTMQAVVSNPCSTTSVTHQQIPYTYKTVKLLGLAHHVSNASKCLVPAKLQEPARAVVL